MQVDKMQEQDAILRLYGHPSMDLIDRTSAKFRCAQEIITELDCIPLAIDLVCAYIKETLISFEDYLKIFKEKKEQNKLLKVSNEEDADQFTIAIVSQLSLEQIRVLNPSAVQLLDIFTFFLPEKIPTRIFQRQFSALNLTASENSESHDAIREPIALLDRFSFITLTTTKGKRPMSQLTIHRILQKVIYDAINDEQKLSWTHIVATALCRETYGINRYNDGERQEIIKVYHPHVIHFVSQQPLKPDDFACLLTNAATYLYGYHPEDKDEGKVFTEKYPSPVTRHIQQSIQIAEAVYGQEHISTATLLYSLARFYVSMDNDDEADMLYERARLICKKLKKSDNPDTLNSVAGLQRCYRRYDMAKAESLYRRVLAIREKVSGPEHLDTAASLMTLGSLYIAREEMDSLYIERGKMEEAEPLYKRAMEIREKVLGPEHPETMTSLKSLTDLYVRQGKYDEAESLCKRAMGIYEKVLTSLAERYIWDGTYDAESLHKRVIEIREKVLGPEHPDTATSLSDLAEFYCYHRKYDEAEPLYKRVIEIREKVLGPEHPDTATSLSDLAMVYRDQHKYDEAEPLYKRAMEIHEKVGLEHRATEDLLNTLVRFYTDQGKHDEAEQLLKQAIESREKVFGPEHLVMLNPL